MGCLGNVEYECFYNLKMYYFFLSFFYHKNRTAG